MSLSIGIVGLPNVGKSTLFNALTDNNILAANYPFATIEPNTGIVPVPDERLEKLAGMYASQKIIPASVTFVDIAGLVAGASQGEGLGNQFLANIRNCQAICHVVRVFADPNVLHVDDTAGRQHDPKKDIDVINTELVLADLQSLQKRLPVLEKEARANPKLSSELNAMKFAKDILDSGTPLFASERAKELDAELSQFQLLTTKPIIYLFNVDETSLTDRARQAELSKMVAPSKAVFVCAKLEHELKSLDPKDQTEMLQSYGVNDSGLKQVIMAAYKTLGLQSYLTAGPKETRAWTVQIGASAPQAAGVIHTDFEKGFIAAQIVDYDDLLAAGSEQAAKQAGKVRTEGKDYIMQPGDVVEFRFNV